VLLWTGGLVAVVLVAWLLARGTPAGEAVAGGLAAAAAWIGSSLAAWISLALLLVLVVALLSLDRIRRRLAGRESPYAAAFVDFLAQRRIGLVLVFIVTFRVGESFLVKMRWPFLHDVMGVRNLDARFDGVVTYHDSCAGLREMGIKAQPRALLGGVEGLALTEMTDPEICCGFGGTFCVKYPDISTRMVTDKCRDIAATGAGTLLAGDMGCLLNMAGRLKREGSPVQVRHVAEVLAGMTPDVAPIGEAGQP
jgi:hypothetical protein